MTTIGSTGRIATFLAAAILLIGLGYTAILPPFEGFDEYAYYSSIRQIADTGTMPLFGKSFIDQKIVRYLETAPTSWGTLHPPFEQADRKTYAAFFKDAKAVDYYRRHWSRAADWSFAASAMQNWESQHPPLYYLLVAPLMKGTEGLTLPTQVLVLRIFSYLLAFLGLMIGWRATALVFPRTDLTAGYLFYPFIFPMFFGEFARIGNDSLCLLLFAVIYSLTLRNIGQSLDRATALATGVCFGLGLLTKAFFIPALAGDRRRVRSQRAPIFTDRCPLVARVAVCTSCPGTCLSCVRFDRIGHFRHTGLVPQYARTVPRARDDPWHNNHRAQARRAVCSAS